MIASMARRTLAALLLSLSLPLAAAAQPPMEPPEDPLREIPQSDLPGLLDKVARDDPKACYTYAQHGLWRNPSNVENAIYLGTVAAKAGLVEAQNFVGFLHKTQGDLDHAILWTKLAADRGHVGAQFRLASYYGERDKVEALKYLILASRSDQNAAYYLQRNAIGASPEERQRAERLAKDWAPVCPGVCSDILGFDRCGVCPLTEQERRSAQ